MPVTCEQSGFPSHPTQAPASHLDALASVQSLFERHSTQVFVAVSQSGVPPSQSPTSMHSTHLSELSSQTGVSPSQAPSHGAVPPVPAVPASAAPPPSLPALPAIGEPPWESPP